MNLSSGKKKNERKFSNKYKIYICLQLRAASHQNAQPKNENIYMSSQHHASLEHWRLREDPQSFQEKKKKMNHFIRNNHADWLLTLTPATLGARRCSQKSFDGEQILQPTKWSLGMSPFRLAKTWKVYLQHRLFWKWLKHVVQQHGSKSRRRQHGPQAKGVKPKRAWSHGPR